MDVYVRLFCVEVASLRRANPASKESYRLSIMETEDSNPGDDMNS
jgi:hypothetical protein